MRKYYSQYLSSCFANTITQPSFNKFSSTPSCAFENHTINRHSLYHPIYVDMQATTPIDFRILDKMLPYLTSSYGNPHSKGHLFGSNAENAVQESRKNIASLLNAQPKEIIFSSGATESNNSAIIGLCNASLKNKIKKNHLITTSIEHKTVLEAMEHAKKDLGFDLTIIDVDQFGRVDLRKLVEIINDKTLLVSAMAMNNEIGVFQDLQALGDLCQQRGVYFHSDAAQAIGKIEIDVKKMHIDFLSFTGHKSFAPKGTGGLYVREELIIGTKAKDQIIKLEPILFGGGQERGLRSGTLSPPMAVALGEAFKISQREIHNDAKHVKKLYDRMLARFSREVPLIKLNGHPQHRFFGNLNLSFKYLLSYELLKEISDHVALSAGAACLDEPSYVLSALKLEKDYALGSVRIGIGRFTTTAEVDYLMDVLIPTIHKLRVKNPLFVKELETTKGINNSI